MSATDPASPIRQSPDIVTLGDETQAAEVIRRSVLGLWQVVNDLTRLRPTERADFRVTIFGSARIPAGPLGLRRRP